MRVFAFDIETIPDVAAGRQLHGFGELSDGDVARAMFHLRRQETDGSDFLPLYLQRVACISVAFRSPDDFKVWTLGDSMAPEAEIIQRFFDGIEKYTPDMVSWNGSGFDLPVLHYRALMHGISAPRYWETGDGEQAFRWNNYLSRFHWRHLDLMDVMAGFQPRGRAPLDKVAQLNGLPGKLGMDGGKVWDAWQAGDIDGIRNYCETDVLNTFLLYLRFERMRGRLMSQEFQTECELVRRCLQQSDKPHLQEFLQAWDQMAGTPTSV
ncbi:MAG TPA: 3'-5' exonuclease [Gammaproteobacteria bacterium]|nr:3'-5' exonuclease [Gammaproteobacteria bacterium]